MPPVVPWVLVSVGMILVVGGLFVPRRRIATAIKVVGGVLALAGFGLLAFDR